MATKYYYTAGTENVDWAVGHSEGVGTQSKESDHLYLYAGPYASGHPNYRSYVTDSAIDFTTIDTLYFDYESDGIVHRIWLGIGTVKADSTLTDKYEVREISKARGVNSLDVSGYTGNYFIKLMVYEASSSYANSKANIYNVYADGTFGNDASFLLNMMR